MSRPPFEWTEEIETEILDRVAKGESVRSICEDDWLPSWPTLRKRLIDDDEFATRYARSKDALADRLFDEILEISDSAKVEDVAVARLRIDARKWMAGKLRPKVYGEKTTHEHGGIDGEPIAASLTVTFK